MKHISVVYLIILLLPVNIATAAGTGDEENPGKSYPLLNVQYVSQVASNGVAIYSAPARWMTRDWITFGVVGGLTAGFYLTDGYINDMMLRNRNPFLNEVSVFAERFGNRDIVIPALAGLFITGYLADSPRLREIGLYSFESALFASVCYQVVQMLSQRKRPGEGREYDDWGGPSLNLRAMSFPSGHTTLAFSVMTVIARLFERESTIIPVAAYGIASLTALSRLYDNRHWASDVFLGASIGYFVASAVVRLHRERPAAMPTVRAVPYMDGKRSGIMVVLGWDW